MSHRKLTTRERAGPRRGLVLVIVLWILVILVILSWGLAATVQTEAHLVRHYSESSRCVEFARAGIEMMSNRLSQEDLSFVARDHPESQLTSEREGLAFQSGGKFEVSMEDEAGKVNLNVASTEMLTALTGDANLAAAIQDWRDQDDSSGPGGAEDSSYIILAEPYHCKNAPFQTVEEVLLVKGASRPMLFESQAGRAPLIQNLTIYSIDENVDRSGQARLNLNSSGRDQLQDRLGDVLTAQEINAILSFRSNARATTRTGPAGATLTPVPIGPPGTAPGEVLGGRLGAASGGTVLPASGSNAGRRFESTGQLLEVPGLTRDKVKKIADRVTVTDDKRIPGRINLNTASEEVLASLPGVTDSIARDIVEYRLGDDGPFEEVGEILAVESVTSDVYRKIADVITTRSSIFKLNSIGVLRQSRTRKLVECVISFLKNESEGTSAPDNTTPSEPGTPLPATILYWRQRP